MSLLFKYISLLFSKCRCYLAYIIGILLVSSLVFSIEMSLLFSKCCCYLAYYIIVKVVGI